MSLKDESKDQKQIPGHTKAGSFWIKKKAIDVLIRNQATATQICAYLVLARFTDAEGKFSTSSFKAIKKAIGIGDRLARSAVDTLLKMGLSEGTKSKLLYHPDKWQSLTGEDIPERPTKIAQVRWVLNDFKDKGGDRIWFSNNLVDGYKRFTQPLKRLKRCRDVAARLLLLLYEQHDMEQYGGVKPYLNFYRKYKMSKISRIVRNFDLWHAKRENDTTYESMASKAVKGKQILFFWENEEYKQSFWDAAASLDSNGFIYEVATVMDDKVDNEEAQPIYILDTKSKYGYKPQGEDGLGGDTARLSGEMGYPVADSTGRLYGKYAVIVPAGITPYVAGIYRIRFRVTNPKNYTVRSSWVRIHEGQKEASEWIAEVSKKIERRKK
jgi:hypothetical protein